MSVHPYVGRKYKLGGITLVITRMAQTQEISVVIIGVIMLAKETYFVSLRMRK
jgi:hypothetical protein